MPQLFFDCASVVKDICDKLIASCPESERLKRQYLEDEGSSVGSHGSSHHQGAASSITTYDYDQYGRLIGSDMSSLTDAAGKVLFGYSNVGDIYVDAVSTSAPLIQEMGPSTVDADAYSATDITHVALQQIKHYAKLNRAQPVGVVIDLPAHAGASAAALASSSAEAASASSINYQVFQGGITNIVGLLTDLQKHRHEPWYAGLNTEQRAVIDQWIDSIKSYQQLLDAIVLLKSTQTYLRNPQPFLEAIENLKVCAKPSITEFVLALFEIYYKHCYQSSAANDSKLLADKLLDNDRCFQPVIQLVAEHVRCSLPVCREKEKEISDESAIATANSLQELAHFLRLNTIAEKLKLLGMPVERAKLVCRFLDYAFNALYLECEQLGDYTGFAAAKTFVTSFFSNHLSNASSALQIASLLITHSHLTSHEVLQLDEVRLQQLKESQGGWSKGTQQLPGLFKRIGSPPARIIGLTDGVLQQPALATFKPKADVAGYLAQCQELFESLYPNVLDGQSKPTLHFSGIAEKIKLTLLTHNAKKKVVPATDDTSSSVASPAVN